MARCVIAGLGSPHGDDAVGWQVVRHLAALWPPIHPPPGCEIVALRTPADLLELLDGTERLVVVDACRSGRAPGEFTRLPWPAARTEPLRAASTHGLDLAAALDLAEALGRLPRDVVVLGIEIGGETAGSSLSPALAEALPDLARRVLEEVRRLSP